MDISEKGLEDIIVDYLRDVNGYNQGDSSEYNKTYALLPDCVEAFIRRTQPEKAEELRVFDTPSERNKFFARLRDEITKPPLYAGACKYYSRSRTRSCTTASSWALTMSKLDTASITFR